MNRGEIYEIEIREKSKLKLIDSNYDSKMKSKAIQRKIRMKHDP